MKNCVYILYCSDERYYVGSTVDLNIRIKQHQNGKVEATKKRRPLKIIFSQEFKTKHDAHKIELWIKKQKSRKLLEQIIADNIIKKRL